MSRSFAIAGAIAGGLIVLYMGVLIAIMGDFSNVTPEQLQATEIFGYLRYVILVVAVVLAMVKYRRTHDGPLGYGRMLGLGVGVAAVTALFVGLFEGVYVATMPEFFDHYARVSAEAMRQNGASADDIRTFEQQLKDFAWMRNPILTGLFYFVETTVIGTAFALVAAVFTRRGDESEVRLQGA